MLFGAVLVVSLFYSLSQPPWRCRCWLSVLPLVVTKLPSYQVCEIINTWPQLHEVFYQLLYGRFRVCACACASVVVCLSVCLFIGLKLKYTYVSVMCARFCTFVCVCVCVCVVSVCLCMMMFNRCQLSMIYRELFCVVS